MSESVVPPQALADEPVAPPQPTPASVRQSIDQLRAELRPHDPPDDEHSLERRLFHGATVDQVVHDLQVITDALVQLSFSGSHTDRVKDRARLLALHLQNPDAGTLRRLAAFLAYVD